MASTHSPSSPEIIKSLYGLQTFGMKFGLRGIRTLLKKVGDPHERVPCIHVAGTNGKGSTAALIASVLTSAGYRTGLYTSPHLVQFEERIRINGKMISAAAVKRIGRRVLPLVLGQQATFFEAATTIAFLWFAEREVDIAVIETGLGGRLDATNVVRPLVSVITSIDREHTHLLGTTLRSITREKAGIIKPGVPCIAGVAQVEVRDQIRRVCAARKAPYRHVSGVASTVVSSGWNGHAVHFTLGTKVLKNVTVPLGGEYQVVNASMALLVIEELRRRYKWKCSATAIRNGFADVCKNTGLAARLSLLRKKPLIVADVAHNPGAMRSLRTVLEQLSDESVILVFGVMKDKDVRRMAEEIGAAVGHVCAVQARTDRSLPSPAVVRAFLRAGVPAEDAGSVRAGLQRALRHPGRHPVVITGSHFVVGEAIAWMNKKRYLTINQ